METRAPTKTLFFKAMSPGFQEKLNLPRAFCKKLPEGEPEGAILESRKGRWVVEACRNGGGQICLKDGWARFAGDHDLSVGDFVVFEHIAGLRFGVSVFGPTTCEREFPVAGSKRERGATEAEKSNSRSKKLREVDSNSVGSYHSKNSYFALSMKPTHGIRNGHLNIPMEFVKSNDLGKKRFANLRDPVGNEWGVKLSVKKSGGCHRILMTTGWPAFYVSNELKERDVCFFDLYQNPPQSTAVSFDVKIFRSSSPN